MIRLLKGLMLLLTLFCAFVAGFSFYFAALNHRKTRTDSVDEKQ